MRKRGLVKDLWLRNNRRPRRKNRGRRVFIGQFFSLLRSWRQANFASFYARHPAADEFSAFSRSTFRINCLWQMYFERSMKSYFTFSHEFDYFLHSWEFFPLQVALPTFLFIPFSSKWYLRELQCFFVEIKVAGCFWIFSTSDLIISYIDQRIKRCDST